MTSRLFLFTILIATLLSCNEEKIGLNPVVGQVDSFLVMQKVINHLEQSKVEKITRLKFTLRSLHHEDSSSRFLFTITDFQLDPLPPYLFEVVNFDSLKSVLASCPYQITVDLPGRITRINGGVQLQNKISAAFANKYTANSFTADYFSANAVTDIVNRLFSATSHKKIREGDNWVRDIVYIVKAPVEISNLFTCGEIRGDSVFIQNKALISANQGDASTVYMKGEQSGNFLISANTGLPYLIETHAKMITTTSGGDLTSEEIFEIKRLN